MFVPSHRGHGMPPAGSAERQPKTNQKEEKSISLSLSLSLYIYIYMSYRFISPISCICKATCTGGPSHTYITFYISETLPWLQTPGHQLMHTCSFCLHHLVTTAGCASLPRRCLFALPVRTNTSFSLETVLQTCKIK